jgi:hypothetical protein
VAGGEENNGRFRCRDRIDRNQRKDRKHSAVVVEGGDERKNEAEDRKSGRKLRADIRIKAEGPIRARPFFCGFPN